LPGALLMLGASVMLFGSPLPAWAQNGLNCGAAASVGLLLASCVQMSEAARNARLWLLFAAAAFVGGTIFEINLGLLIVGLGTMSLMLNRGRRLVGN
jgi:chromate transport protein ChrA